MYSAFSGDSKIEEISLLPYKVDDDSDNGLVSKETARLLLESYDSGQIHPVMLPALMNLIYELK